MRYTAAQVLELLEQSDEHSTLEAKGGQKVDKSILETVCAFANEPGMDGGLLLLGVEPAKGEERRYRLVGLRDPDKVQTDLATQARSSFNHPVQVELSTEVVEGKTLVLAQVKETSTHLKPIYISSQGLPKGAYRRVGSVDQRLTHEELQEFFAAQDGETFDQTSIKDTVSDDLDPKLVRAYRELSKTSVTFDDNDLLYSLNTIDSHQTPSCTLAGLSLVSEEQFGRPGSVTRNEKIAAVLHEIGYAETKGSGIRAMREAMKRPNLSYPVIHSDRENNRFTLILLSHHFLSEDDIRWLSQFKELNLSEVEARVLIASRELGAITNSVVRALCALDTLAASSLLGRLRTAGLLEKKSAGSATYYVPTFSTQSVAQLKLPGLEEDSQNTDDSFRHKDGSFRHKDLSEKLSKKLESLGQRASRQVLEELILELCDFTEMSRKELATLLGRSERHIERYLSSLIDEGRIRKTKPLSNTPSPPILPSIRQGEIFRVTILSQALGETKRRRLYQNLVLSCLLLAACALSASMTSTSPKAEALLYSVDGVSLGMTEREVHWHWGDLERFAHRDDKTVLLSKPGSSPVNGNQALLDPSGKVVEVSGHRLRYGSELLLGPNHEFEEGFKLGQRAENQASFCGHTGPLKMGRCTKGPFSFVFIGFRTTSLELEPGQSLATILEQHPYLTKVNLVRLELHKTEG